MKKGLRLLAVAGLMVFSLSSFMPAKNVFTAEYCNTRSLCPESGI